MTVVCGALVGVCKEVESKYAYLSSETGLRMYQIVFERLSRPLLKSFKVDKVSIIPIICTYF